MMLLLNIFFEFCKIGLISFGGGNAIFPILQREIVEDLQWISRQDLLNFVSIAETTPGPTGMNLSTFVGFKLAGFPGALVGTLGYVILPFIIMLIIAVVSVKIKDNAIYRKFIGTIMVVVLALLVRTVYLMAEGGFKDYRYYILALGVFIVFMRYKKLNPAYLLILSGLIGVFL